MFKIYVEKSETQFNLKLKNQRNDVTRKDNIPAWNYFNIEGHNFKSHSKLIIIEQRNQTNREN